MRTIEVIVTEKFSKRYSDTNNIISFSFDYEKHKVELKNVGSKQMILVSTKSGENKFLIDSDYVMAIDYDGFMM